MRRLNKLARWTWWVDERIVTAHGDEMLAMGTVSGGG
jgi:hypothetical protein